MGAESLSEHCLTHSWWTIEQNRSPGSQLSFKECRHVLRKDKGLSKYLLGIDISSNVFECDTWLLINNAGYSPFYLTFQRFLQLAEVELCREVV